MKKIFVIFCLLSIYGLQTKSQSDSSISPVTSLPKVVKLDGKNYFPVVINGKNIPSDKRKICSICEMINEKQDYLVCSNQNAQELQSKLKKILSKSSFKKLQTRHIVILTQYMEKTTNRILGVCYYPSINLTGKSALLFTNDSGKYFWECMYGKGSIYTEDDILP